MRSTPEGGLRAGYDGAKRKKGSKLHIAVDTFGHLLVLHVTPANRDDRAGVGRLAAAIQDVTDESVELAYFDRGYTGQKPAEAVRAYGIALEVVKLPEAKRGFVLLSRRWVVERSFAWAELAKVPSAKPMECQWRAHDAEDSLRITSATLQRSQVSMSSLSHASCSETPLYSFTVHNTL